MHSNELFWSSSSWEHAWPILNMHGSKIELSNRYFNALMWPFKRFHTKTQLITFCQSILLGWLIFLVSKKKIKNRTWLHNHCCWQAIWLHGTGAGWIHTNVQGIHSVCHESLNEIHDNPSHHHTTTQLNKVWRVVMEKWLPDYKTALFRRMLPQYDIKNTESLQGIIWFFRRCTHTIST